MSAFNANRARAVEDVVQNDPVASAIRALMDAERDAGRTIWAGNSQSLLTALAEIAGAAITRGKAWPADATRLSGRVTRAATFLRAIGIEVVHRKAGDRKFFFPIRGAKQRPQRPQRPNPKKTAIFPMALAPPLAPGQRPLAPA